MSRSYAFLHIFPHSLLASGMALSLDTIFFLLYTLYWTLLECLLEVLHTKVEIDSTRTRA